MKLDTPLAEVAHHLPADTAGVLLELPEDVQESVLAAIRQVVVNLEVEGVDLDAVTYAAVVGQVGLVAIAGHFEVWRLRLAMAHASEWLGEQVTP